MSYKQNCFNLARFSYYHSHLSPSPLLSHTLLVRVARESPPLYIYTHRKDTSGCPECKHGHCDRLNGVCECEQGVTGFDCSEGRLRNARCFANNGWCYVMRGVLLIMGDVTQCAWLCNMLWCDYVICIL